MTYFKVLPPGSRIPQEARSTAFLLSDNWNDWFRYQTLYVLIIFDSLGESHQIGNVKIGQFRMQEGQPRPAIPDAFDALDDRFFSLGQDDNYYDDLNKLGPDIRDKILIALQDVARDPELFSRALEEKVTGVSLLRTVSKSAVYGQFHRIARGGARLSRYDFSYTANTQRAVTAPLKLSFLVEPASFPPTNIHVLIGRNGVGKTTILNNMARCIVEKETPVKEMGAFQQTTNDPLEPQLFTRLVSVTFSAFDPFEPISDRRDRSEGPRYEYIGLKRVTTDKDGKPRPPKSPDDLSIEFGSSVLLCRRGAAASRWRHALEMLETDPIFREAEVADLARSEASDDELKAEARKLFRLLSSGHKIVLLTITRLIETVEEKTLVLLDEPEAHLHPPLLSSFVRALSDLLINRNGVAIVATHSPVVLQEVPKSCVWILRRSGLTAMAERPNIETFGENVAILTREVFGLEVTQSGFHKMLYDSVQDLKNFDDVVNKFGAELGGEARAIVQGLLAAHSNEGKDSEDFL